MMQRRATTIRKAIAEFTKEPSIRQEELDELALKVKVASDEELGEIGSGTPIVSDESIIYDVWTELGASYFAGLPIDQRWVYSSDGRGGTKKLAVLADVMRRIRFERERVDAALKKSGAWDRLQSTANSGGPEEFLASLGVGEVENIVAEVTSTQTSVVVVLNGFDKRGKGRINFYDAIYLDEAERSTLMDAAQDGPVAQPAEAVAIRKDFAAVTSNDDTSEDNAFIKFLANLPNRDILSYDVSEVLFGVAESLKKPLAGRLSDDLVSSLGFSGLGRIDVDEGPKLTIKTGLQWLDDDLQCEVSPQGIVTVRPELPAHYQSTFPRKEVSDYVRANRGKQLMDFDRLPGLIVAPRSLDAERTAEIAFLAHKNTSEFWDVETAFAATWAGLSPQQKHLAAGKDGVTLPLSKCGSALRHDFQYAAVSYGQWSMLVASLATDREHEDQEARDLGIADFMMFDVGEDTFRDFKINFRTSRSPNVLIYLPDDEDPQTVTAVGLAEWYYTLEVDKMADALKQLNAAEYGIDDVMKIEVQYQTPVGLMRNDTSVRVTDTGPRGLKLQQLPAPILDEFNRALAELRKGGGQPAAR